MGKSPSLTGRLIGGLIIPLALFGLALGIGAAVSVRHGVIAVSDGILLASAHAISESLTVEDRQITLDMPASAFAMLDNEAHDSVFYAVHRNGQLITGYPDLLRVGGAGLLDGQHVFADAEFRGRPIRIVAEARHLPQVDTVVIVEVGETIGDREMVSSHILWLLTGLEAALIALTLVLIPLAVHWGIHPLIRLRRTMDGRPASDFTPIPLDQAPNEMRDLVSSFNALLHRLDSAAEGVRRFAADASHQMRTPLSVLRAHVAVLRKARIRDVATRSSLDDIELATNRLERLVTQLLALGRAENVASDAAEFEKVDLNAFARSVTEGFALMASRSGVSLEFDAVPGSATVLTRTALAHELVANVIDNAIRYNRDGGRVTVCTRRAADRGQIVIEDDGPGIPPADRDRVFLRFVRLTSETAREGTGLGLSIAMALAKVLEVGISLDTATGGQGLKVVLDFPAGVVPAGVDGALPKTGLL